MNAERLHAICLSIQEEINKLNIQNNIKQLSEFLQNAINQPQNPEIQKQIGNVLSNLYNQLSTSNSDNFSPAWRQSLEEIGGENLLGKKLLNRIREVFERNRITISIALSDIQKIREEFDQFKSGIDNTISGLKLLKIGSEKLRQGECEVGFTIPRKAINNNINEFGRELQEISFILGVLSEISSGQRENYDIKSISSSDLSVFMVTIPAVAACIAHATERIIQLYKNFLDIRKIKKELKILGLKEKDMQGISDHAKRVMEDGINNISAEIMKIYYIGTDESRKNELTNALKITLSKIANRIDQGFNVEVRAEPSTTPEENEDQEKYQEFIKKINDAANTLQFLKLEGDRILRLSEKTKEDDNNKPSN